MTDRLDSAKLARIDERVANLDKSFASHEKQDEQRFDRVFNYMKDRFDKLDTRLDMKLDTLWDDKNKQAGAFSAGRLFAGAIGGLFVAIIDYFTFGPHR